VKLALKTEKIKKNYGKNTVLNGINMNVHQGDIYGFIGKNGAGKTTFLKILLGLTYESSGNISLFNSQNRNELTENRNLLSGIIEMPSFYAHMTAYENLRAYCLLRKIDKKNINTALELVGLGDVGKKKVGKFSLGMKQRLGIAKSICGNSSLIVLDEPTNGLDPEGIVSFRKLIQRLNKEFGITFIISSHHITELQKISTRFGLLVDGKLIEEMSSDELTKKIGNYTNLIVSNAQKASEVLQMSYPNTKFKVSGSELSINNDVNIGKFISALTDDNIEVHNIQQGTSSFEEYILNIIGGEGNSK